NNPLTGRTRPRRHPTLEAPIPTDAANRRITPPESALGVRGAAPGTVPQSGMPRSHRRHDVQLKRALRGAAFARGALFPLRSTMSAERFDELFRTLQLLETDIVSELGKVRS